MKQPNNQHVTKQKLKKFYWPLWFPYPSSWLKALILTLFLRVIIFIVKNAGKIGYNIVYFVHSPELFFIFTILLILSPIPIISLTHHCLYLLISRFVSEIQAPEIGRIQGLLPGIMSWWEGLYAWLVIVISTLIAAFFSTILLPLFYPSYDRQVEYYTQIENVNSNLILIFGLFYISAGALIYQIKCLVRDRIISAYYGNKKKDTTESNINLNTEKELNRLRGEMGLHTIKSNILSDNQKNTVIENRRKARNLNKTLLFVFIIFSISLGIYFSSRFVEIFPLTSKSSTQIPSKPVLVTPSPVISESPTVLLKADTFREAVSKAINAANLTQSAKSPDEWKIVVSQWQAAIALMKAVPSSSPNYVVAQQKISEYQRNFNYAQKNSLGNK
ncbi:hypothetical protein [Nostoc sp. 'Lobaria pulmonaria (5183) cyanobiont']|uniref:hypothetical protein n=1 Tax=Nostoc sp. 'Lobaria pulmonaria (5183) cyanobiont' TaxID=1618022 RepID=UPI000CF2FF2A|nr:hypothetical protein [Nostoc sp. 'Lobaria pulmonaria (5183) cyanobiont']AVH71062.1 hypothetical protein NLP_2360 [Nostoc sp. 'Lobaria pulmonaria (5183) cyanobiont']